MSFTVRALNFDYEKTGGGFWQPEFVDQRRAAIWSQSWTGVRFNGWSALLLRKFSPSQRGTTPSSTHCIFRNPRFGGGDNGFDLNNLLSSLNVGNGFSTMAPEGEYHIELKLRWIDRNLIPEVDGCLIVDDWELSVTANGIQIELIKFKRPQNGNSNWSATYYQNHWKFEVHGDNVNSMNPKTTTPSLTFSPYQQGGVATAATNDNDAFNTGITFDLESDAEHIDTKFVGNFPPYRTSFHYVEEDQEEPNEWDLELQIGQTYTFPIMAVQEFEDTNRRFVASLISTDNSGDRVDPVNNGFSIDRKTGTITWTPEFADGGNVWIDGVSGFDEWYRMGLSFKIGSGGGEDPPA